MKGEVYKKDEEILKEGQKTLYLYLIVKGSCAVKKEDKVIDILERGDVFGAYELILDKPANFSVKALEDCIVYLLPKEAIENLSRENPEIREALTKELVEKLAEGYQHFTGNVEDSFVLIPVKELRLQPPLFLPPDVSVQEAAKEMYENGSSVCLLNEATLICNIENLFGGSLLDKYSEGAKYFDVIVSLMN
ncbi:MAG: cyclic nucleotide-binding domain-containing protein, partial [Desulfurobacteriaceae bacterium]